jgi:hypothetical protein
MKKSKFSLLRYKEKFLPLVSQTDHKILGMWAIDCAARALPYFTAEHPNDPRPQQALDTLQTWIDTGKFSMAVIRKASLDSHAAARDVGEDNPARSAARAAGQAVATAHVPDHAIGAAIYTLQAIHRFSSADKADAAVAKEYDWQYQRLVELGMRKSDA